MDHITLQTIHVKFGHSIVFLSTNKTSQHKLSQKQCLPFHVIHNVVADTVFHGFANYTG